MNHEEKEEPCRPQDLTRRQWLMRLGEAAVLVGFSGLAGDLPAGATEQSAPSVQGLPPGLYAPMSDHLAHALVSDERFHPVPPGTPTDFVRPLTGPYRPAFFSSREFETVGRIVELLLGEPATPPAGVEGGKKDEEAVRHEVAQWIDLVASRARGVREAAAKLSPAHRVAAAHYYGTDEVGKLEKDEPEKACRAGLQWLDDESTRRHAKPFLSLAEPEQIELLSLISDERNELPADHAGVLFFRWMKGKVIQGFYTSKAGLKELDYKGNSFYAQSPGCPGGDHST